MSKLPFGHLLPTPTTTRRGIPFYHEKTEEEFKQDVYERYDELVTRQTALHLADELHGNYPFAPLLDYLRSWLPEGEMLTVADLGCSVGRLAAEVALSHTNWDVYGIDLSYQMLRQGQDYWVNEQTLRPNLVRYGWGTPGLAGHRLDNLHFALARAESLPFPKDSLDVIINTFLIDRLPNPISVFAEWRRVLRPGGRVITVSPLNFLRADSWRTAHPPVKILHQLQRQNWLLLDWTDPLSLAEPMDARGNSVNWECLAFVLQ
ncbi:MAG: class I SAM-dependent methyltransferase [Bacteroidota bacterium]